MNIPVFKRPSNYISHDRFRPQNLFRQKRRDRYMTSSVGMCIGRRPSKHRMLIQCCFDVGPPWKTVGGSTSRLNQGRHCIQRRDD